LRSLGIRVEIDDFGTGYSSLRYLQVLEVDSVKIDRQFVEASVMDRTSEKIVRALIGLCHELGFETVAEGVAEREVWDLVAALGCDSAQGHFIAAALPATKVSPWLEDWAMRRDELASAGAHRPTGPIRDGDGPRILVVDDDPGILAIVRDVLQQQGYRVETASNGAEALRSVEARRPSFVLLDVHMPILSGEGFVKGMRERGIDLPVVVMTAGPAAEHWSTALEAQGTIPKPFGIPDLLAVAARFTRSAIPVPASAFR
jgi:CheY-like chemotaxis protein